MRNRQESTEVFSIKHSLVNVTGRIVMVIQSGGVNMKSHRNLNNQEQKGNCEDDAPFSTNQHTCVLYLHHTCNRNRPNFGDYKQKVDLKATGNCILYTLQLLNFIWIYYHSPVSGRNNFR